MRAVNLIPADQRTRGGLGAGRSEGAAYAVVALLAGIALLAFLYGSASHQVSSRRSEAARLTAQAQSEQAQASALAPYTSFASMRQQRIQAVETLMASRFDWAHAVHEFGRVLPSGVSITSLDGTVATAGPGGASTPSASATAKSGGPVASSTPPGAVPQFTITGCASSQPTVALTLERLHLMDGVTNVTLTSSTKNSNGGGGASCPTGDPEFNVAVTFQGLPTAAAAQSAVAVSDRATKGAGR